MNRVSSRPSKQAGYCRQRLLVALLLPSFVAACVPPVPPPTSQYRLVEPIAPLTIAFLPGTIVIAPADLSRLRAVRAILPNAALPELELSGRFALGRARSVRDALGRPILLRPKPPFAWSQDEALITIPLRSKILPDNCRGPGVTGADDIWPGDDNRRPRLLPPGCATDNSIALQAAQPGDLLFGRPLPDGNSLPFADAIERYDRRNEGGPPFPPPQSATTPSGGNGSVEPVPFGTPGTPGLANPLLGSLPGASGTTNTGQ